MGNGDTLSVNKFKILCMSDGEMSDKEISSALRMVCLSSEEDISELCYVLHKYRPKVEKDFVSELKQSFQQRFQEKMF